MLKNLVFAIAFFTFSGYYAGLGLLFAANLKTLSRFYSLPLRIVLSAIMVYLLYRYRHKLLDLRKNIYVMLFLIFWCFYTVKVLTSFSFTAAVEFRREWFEYVLYAITYVIIPFVSLYALPFDKYHKIIINGFIWSGLILGALSVFLYGKLLGTGIGRLNMATYETGEDVLNPLSLSYSASLTIILCTAELIFSTQLRKGRSLILVSAITLSFIMFLLGSSRGSVVTIAISMVIIFFLTTMRSKLIMAGILTLMTPVMIWALEASGSSLIDRLMNTSKDDGGGRASLWSNAFEHFSEHPVFGGLIEIGGIYPHNFVVETLMSTGIVGAFLIFPVIMRSLSGGLQIARRDPENIYLLLILIHGIFYHLFTAGFYTAILLFLPAGLILRKLSESYE